MFVQLVCPWNNNVLIAAKKLAAQVAVGENSSNEKKAKIIKDKRTLSAVLVQYMDEYAYKKKKPRSAQRDAGLFRFHVLPKLGSIPITSIARQDS